MGQQQLLLIVLGVIIVGVAVVVGMNLYQANARQANTEQLATETKTILYMYLKYYKTPVTMGGGGGSTLNYLPSFLEPIVQSDVPQNWGATFNITNWYKIKNRGNSNIFKMEFYNPPVVELFTGEPLINLGVIRSISVDYNTSLVGGGGNHTWINEWIYSNGSSHLIIYDNVVY